MEHLSDVELIDLIGACTSSERTRAAGEHLAVCPSCKARYDEFLRTWQRLDAWGVQPPAMDLSARIIRAAKAGRPSRSRAWTIFKAAASILVAVGLGFGSARWMRRQEVASAPAIGADDVVDSLRLDVLSRPAPTGLVGALFEESPSASEEVGS